jgi:hypothetical protein
LSGGTTSGSVAGSTGSASGVNSVKGTFCGGYGI